MTMHEASRTLVKSSPELWAECSDAATLARHLGAFGEIRITKLEPETAVAWEGDEVRGTVTLEPSGWGTRVVLTATPEGTEPGSRGQLDRERQPESFVQCEPEAEEAAQPESAAQPEPAARGGVAARLFRRLSALRPERKPLGEDDPLLGLTRGGEDERPEPNPEPEPEPQPDVEPEPEPEVEVLLGALDSLGTAHRRPFSRG